MKRFIVLMVTIIMLAGCESAQITHIISRHRTVSESESIAAWSRAHAYCARYGIPFVDVNEHVINVEDVIITRELYNGKAILRYTTTFSFMQDWEGGIYPKDKSIAKYKLMQIEKLFDYISLGDSPEKYDKPVPKTLK